ncbi:ABC transporter ATP-binding protein [Lacrimispora amygdalina]|uniref:ABC transporter ATP-binding protein n=1 Tax=Lacrimispora amygdalina TaxID=253257 RepID=UPI000BE4053F|nr:ABC transporter ATP-binding protein [Lacrimispora amygdalina]
MELMIKNLEFSYQKHSVLKKTSFTLKGGQLVCILGKNGAGKSTLFRCILGFLKGFLGTICIDDRNQEDYTEREIAKKIAYIPQSHDTVFSFPVIDMVMMGTAASLPLFGSPGIMERKKATEALEMMGIVGLKDRIYSQLSGGEQQLVLIARAIAQDARILLLDEPCASLDYGNQIRVMKELKNLSEQGYLIVMSTHNPEHAFYFAHQAMVMMEGEVAALGEPSEVLTKELLQKLYQVPIDIYEDGSSGRKICMPGKESHRCGNYMIV